MCIFWEEGTLKNALLMPRKLAAAPQADTHRNLFRSENLMQHCNNNPGRQAISLPIRNPTSDALLGDWIMEAFRQQ